NLAAYLDDTTFYSFNFIEEEDRIRQYARLIVKARDRGPYVLLGYSAGGILAFETAKELEKQGQEVRALILLDFGIKTGAEPGDKEDEEAVDKMLEMFSNNALTTLEKVGLSSLKKEVVNKLRNYINYLTKSELKGVVNAGIHHLISEFRGEDESTDLGGYTTGDFKLYQGFGEHNDMLEPGN
ncbi:MAG: hypothetical protein GY940_11875, partial [bacterium]|nr:hypothetical protein [bacterium]